MQSEMKTYIQNVTGYNASVTESVILAFRNYIEKSLKEGKEIKIENFGVFGFKDLPPKVSRNPRTGEAVNVPAKTKPTFKYSAKFVQAIANGNQFFTNSNNQSNQNDEFIDSDDIPFANYSKNSDSKPIIINDFTETNQNQNQNQSSENSNYKIWIVNIDNQTLQIPEGNLKSAGLTDDSMVWDSKSNSWEKANSFSELEYLFN